MTLKILNVHMYYTYVEINMNIQTDRHQTFTQRIDIYMGNLNRWLERYRLKKRTWKDKCKGSLRGTISNLKEIKTNQLHHRTNDLYIFYNFSLFGESRRKSKMDVVVVLGVFIVLGVFFTSISFEVSKTVSNRIFLLSCILIRSDSM